MGTRCHPKGAASGRLKQSHKDGALTRPGRAPMEVRGGACAISLSPRCNYAQSRRNSTCHRPSRDRWTADRCDLAAPAADHRLHQRSSEQAPLSRNRGPTNISAHVYRIRISQWGCVHLRGGDTVHPSPLRARQRASRREQRCSHFQPAWLGPPEWPPSDHRLSVTSCPSGSRRAGPRFAFGCR